MMAVGMILTILGSTGMGCYYCFRYVQRIFVLRELQKAMLYMQGEMRYGRSSLLDIFEKLTKNTKGDVKNFFDDVKKRVEYDFQKRWEQSVRERMTVLSSEEQENLIWLGISLGIQDLEGQLMQMEQYKIRTSQALQELEMERKKHMKLYPALGIGMGALVCIFFL